jgi:predicted molibdopterin-dependent oxidoreductase YjgC
MSGRIPGLGERELLEFTFDGDAISAWAGDTIAMALWAADEVAVRKSSRDAQPRGVLCNMGICYECLVMVEGVAVRSCTTLVKAGMRVTRGGKQ